MNNKIKIFAFSAYSLALIAATAYTVNYVVLHEDIDVVIEIPQDIKYDGMFLKQGIRLEGKGKMIFNEGDSSPDFLFVADPKMLKWGSIQCPNRALEPGEDDDCG